jgi:hypothetical protein
LLPLETVEDLVLFGEAADLLLREEDLPVEQDVELAAAAGRDGRVV